jgi:ATP-dependent DNA ligase
LESTLKEDDKYMSCVHTDVVKSLAEAYVIYRHYLSLGEEGAIAKNPDGAWKDTTSRDEVKLKLEVEKRLVLYCRYSINIHCKFNQKKPKLKCLF